MHKEKLRNILQRELRASSSSWSVGSFGAIGEFHQDEGESLALDDTENLARNLPWCDSYRAKR